MHVFFLQYNFIKKEYFCNLLSYVCIRKMETGALMKLMEAWHSFLFSLKQLLLCMIWYKFVCTVPSKKIICLPLLWNSDFVDILLYFLHSISIVKIIASLLLLSVWSLLILTSYGTVTGGHGSFLLLVSHRSTMMMVFGWGWMMRQ